MDTDADEEAEAVTVAVAEAVAVAEEVAETVAVTAVSGAAVTTGATVCARWKAMMPLRVDGIANAAPATTIRPIIA